MTVSHGQSPDDQRERVLRILDLQERERMLIAYDIHDGFVQDVLSAQIGIDGMLDRLAATDPESVPPLLKVRQLVRKAIDEARRVVCVLRPATSDDRGLAESIQLLVSEAETTHRLQVRFTYPADFPALPSSTSGILVRIVQESLNNIKRHSGAHEAHVRLTHTAREIRLEIEDKGSGFDPATVPPGRFGLEGIRQRALVLSGKATIRSRPGQGTVVTVVLPWKRAASTKRKPASRAPSRRQTSKKKPTGKRKRS